MDILSNKGRNEKNYSPNDLANIWAQSVKPASPTSPSDASRFHERLLSIIKDRGTSQVKQVVLCAMRSFLQQMRTINSYWLEIFVGTLAGLLMVSLI